MPRGAVFRGLEIELHRHPGLRVLRVVHPREQQIEEHRHDWSYIGIYTAGRYLEGYDGGEGLMSGPSAVLHPAGRPHADAIAEQGLETLTVEFDLAWLRRHGFSFFIDRSRLWSGGPSAHAAREVASIVTSRCSEAVIGAATSKFLHIATQSEAPVTPPWLGRARTELHRASVASTNELARRLELHPAYLARAYRHVTGEGLHETARRSRVEHASSLLRNSSLALAEIAVASGFCDQSHMNRCFNAVLGRSPAKIRGERITVG